MRLINAEDIPYTMLYKENWLKGAGEEAQGAWKRDIDKMPTIDAVPVVRCRDCRWQGDDEHCPVCNCCGREALPNGEWYCAYGERKDDATND